MELYLDLLSPPYRSVFLFPKVVGIPFEFKHVNLLSGNPTPHSKEFGKISMVRKVPVMKDAQFVTQLLRVCRHRFVRVESDF
uniref:GST N-terminal domain-containing protein n=1 Tax=Monopterus albus TaxID=43700 RepID=A0A3Q3J0F7_MONAL